MNNSSSSSIPTNPFESYPQGGRSLLGKLNTDYNCRHKHGLELRQRTHTQRAICAYCGTDFTENFTAWMAMSVDHVVPIGLADIWSIPKQWYTDMINCVFCCRGCNELNNQEKLEELSYTPPQEWTLEEFLCLRDRAFFHRFQKIAKRREEEQDFYISAWGG